MKKYLVIALLVIVGLAIAYLTFIIAAIKIIIGSILLGVAAIALLAVWIMWKIDD
ncbi:hypothetical protein K8089_00370 [Aequorivita sp. F47161]|uniref:Uncharacterized protein n=1 Tax=Aequorivita vitellina TaxID=2874475 RepID=A0A9X1U8H9_9FLAO|nr:hypothetical protein [Aequorivita vitellina]MCG2417456.1 hypothetical protein [Aequorivita vitellina]MCZ4318283.1 hypothetical protein [Aequorivita viscosa]